MDTSTRILAPVRCAICRDPALAGAQLCGLHETLKDEALHRSIAWARGLLPFRRNTHTTRRMKDKRGRWVDLHA